MSGRAGRADRDGVGRPLPTLDDVKFDAVLARLQKFRGDKRATAESLGVSLKCLYENMHRWGLLPPVRHHAAKGHRAA